VWLKKRSDEHSYTVSCGCFEQYNRCENLRSVLVQVLDCVIPAWSAGIQIDMDVSGASLRIWMPAIHAGTTRISMFYGELRLMKHFVEIEEDSQC
jgi:hypothetical protein